jgi:hypothetical protein
MRTVLGCKGRHGNGFSDGGLIVDLHEIGPAHANNKFWSVMTKMMPDMLRGAGLIAIVAWGVAIGPEGARAQEQAPLPVPQSHNLAPRPLGPTPAREIQRQPVQIRTGQTMTTPAIQLKRLSAPITGDPTAAANAAEGLGRDAWADTPESLVPALLNALPVGAPSPTMGALSLALLSTPGPKSETAPSGRTGLMGTWGGSGGTTSQPLQARVNIVVPQSSESEDPAISRMRYERMLNAGFFDHVSRRITASKGSAKTGALDDILAASFLLQGDHSRACDLSLDHRLQSDEPIWIQLRAFCYLENKTPAAAQLTADLLRDRGIKAPAFYALTRQLSGGGAASDEDLSGSISPLEFALLRKAGRLPPESALTTSAAAPLRAFVMHHADFGGTGADVLLLKSAQEAILTGAVSPQDLRALYDRIGFPTPEPGQALEFAKTLPPELATAFYYQQAKQNIVPAIRAEFLNEALKAANAAGRFLPTVLAFGNLITGVTPDPTMGQAAGYMGLGAVTLGDMTKAVAWYELLTTEAAREATPALIDARDQLALALAVADGNAARALGSQLNVEARIARASADPKSARRLARDLQILNATGVPLSTHAELWLFGLEQGMGVQAPPVSVTARLADAVNKRRTAEAIALALTVAGKDGPQSESPYFLAQSIRALSVLGLNREARRLALEAILAPAQRRKRCRTQYP